MALLIKTNNEVFHRTPSDGFAFLPSEIEELLSKKITLLEISSDAVLAIEEDQDNPSLQVNHWATALAWRKLKKHETIKGDVLFIKIKELD